MSKFDPEQEAEDLLADIEEKYPSDVCSLKEYREVLTNLVPCIRNRIELLNEEIG